MVWKAIIGLGSLGIIFSIILVIAYTKFRVEFSEKLKKIIETLPGANCGACGFGGCEAYAKALVEGKASPDLCAPGGRDVATKLATILGKEVKLKEPQIAFVRCQGAQGIATDRFEYIGIETCKSANIIGGGYKGCEYGCLGFGDCVSVCKFNAIHMGENGLPVIDEGNCTGCGACVSACPRGIITLIPESQKTIVACISKDKGPLVRKVCKKGCIACGICEKVCPTGAIKVIDNVAIIDPEKCTNCGICVYKCPTKAIIEKIKFRPTARIDENLCTRCGECAKVCPTKAITGDENTPYKVNVEKCIGCGECQKVCKPKAITLYDTEGLELSKLT